MIKMYICTDQSKALSKYRSDIAADATIDIIYRETNFPTSENHSLVERKLSYRIWVRVNKISKVCRYIVYYI